LTSLLDKWGQTPQDIKQRVYSDQEMREIHKSPVPKHIAIIPDGNRRWAKKHLLKISVGHKSGGDRILDIVKAAEEIGIETLTIYLFSTENWNRPDSEVKTLFSMLEHSLKEQTPRMIKEGVRVHTIGELSDFPAFLQERIQMTKEQTEHCSNINLILALNYGGRSEIINACRKMCSEVQDKGLSPNDISEENFAKHLETRSFTDPDLLIRTSGEQRISNYLLWSISYSELYFTKVLWPDFDSNELLKAVTSFQNRERRWGN